MVNEKKAISV